MFKEVAFGIIIGVMFISLVVLFCILLVKLYINKIKTFAEELYQKDIDFQKTLMNAVMETQEQVLNNISQDLHDDAGQQLTYINFQLENLKLDSEELSTKLEPISHSVQILSQSVRSISHSLNNQLLLQQNLMKVIAAEVKRLQKNSNIMFISSLKEMEYKEFSPNEKIIIYRIFQECINNCLKHANATEIKIILTLNPLFEMVITDNGRGFSQINCESKNSMGLINLYNRASSINYNLDIKTLEGFGTTVRLTENVIV